MLWKRPLAADKGLGGERQHQIRGEEKVPVLGQCPGQAGFQLQGQPGIPDGPVDEGPACQWVGKLCGSGGQRGPAQAQLAGNDRTGQRLLVDHHDVGPELFDGRPDTLDHGPGHGKQHLEPQELEGRGGTHPKGAAIQSLRELPRVVGGSREEALSCRQQLVEDAWDAGPGRLVATASKLSSHGDGRVDVAGEVGHDEEEPGHAVASGAAGESFALAPDPLDGMIANHQAGLGEHTVGAPRDDQLLASGDVAVTRPGLLDDIRTAAVDAEHRAAKRLQRLARQVCLGHEVLEHAGGPEQGLGALRPADTRRAVADHALALGFIVAKADDALCQAPAPALSGEVWLDEEQAGHTLGVVMSEEKRHDAPEAVAEEVNGFVDVPGIKQANQVGEMVGDGVAALRHLGATVAAQVVEVHV